jgi:hypothetical protein
MAMHQAVPKAGMALDTGLPPSPQGLHVGAYPRVRALEDLRLTHSLAAVILPEIFGLEMGGSYGHQHARTHQMTCRPSAAGTPVRQAPSGPLRITSLRICTVPVFLSRGSVT